MEKAIIIQGRLDSKRFPQKILKKIDNRTVLQFLIDSLLDYFDKKEIIIATTEKKSDKKICKIAQNNDLKYFCGSENNLLNRYLKCSKKYKIKNIIRVTSDCPLADPRLIKKMYNFFIKKKLDYYSNTYPPDKSKFPDGSDIEIFTNKSLNKLNKIPQKKEDKEHIYGFWKKKKYFKIKILKSKKDISQFKYSIDYNSDLFLVRKVVKILKKKKLLITPKNVTTIIKEDKKLQKISNKNRILYLKNKNFKNIVL